MRCFGRDAPDPISFVPFRHAAPASLKGTDEIASGATRRSVRNDPTVPVRDELVPNIFLIKAEFIPAIESTHLILEYLHLVVFFLVVDIFLNRGYLLEADRER